MMLAKHNKTMKDYFAAKAMQSLLLMNKEGKLHNSIANEAYEIAKAMMKAREKHMNDEI